MNGVERVTAQQDVDLVKGTSKRRASTARARVNDQVQTVKETYDNLHVMVPTTASGHQVSREDSLHLHEVV